MVRVSRSPVRCPAGRFGRVTVFYIPEVAITECNYQSRSKLDSSCDVLVAISIVFVRNLNYYSILLLISYRRGVSERTHRQQTTQIDNDRRTIYDTQQQTPPLRPPLYETGQ